MTKLLLFLAAGSLVVGCTTPPTVEKDVGANGKARQQRGSPSLDRTYDFGARPPGANPAHDPD
jgi:hypothetical protein